MALNGNGLHGNANANKFSPSCDRNLAAPPAILNLTTNSCGLHQHGLRHPSAKALAARQERLAHSGFRLAPWPERLHADHAPCPSHHPEKPPPAHGQDSGGHTGRWVLDGGSLKKNRARLTTLFWACRDGHSLPVPSRQASYAGSEFATLRRIGESSVSNRQIVEQIDCLSRAVKVRCDCRSARIPGYIVPVSGRITCRNVTLRKLRSELPPGKRHRRHAKLRANGLNPLRSLPFFTIG